MSNQSFVLVTSNENKLREFKRFGIEDLSIEKGADIREIDADPITVVAYKAKAAGKKRIVEDTSLHVEGADVGVNVKWLMENISQFSGTKAIWQVLLGVNDGESVCVYEGLVAGEIANRFEEPVGFGFDCMLIPKGQEEGAGNEPLTLYELELAGQKDDFSARKRAVQALLSGNPIRKFSLSHLPEWIGNYQNE